MASDDVNAPPVAVSREEVRLARRMVKASRVPSRDVEDVTQEVLCALAFRRAPLFVPAGSTPERARRLFLWGVVQRQVANHRRRAARRRLGDIFCFEAVQRDPEPTAEAVLMELSNLGVLARALAWLAETHPELFEVLERVLSGERISAIACRLRLPEGTVWTRLRRARLVLCAFMRG